MPGPNSVPSGDTTLMRGHANEKFMCSLHKVEWCTKNCDGDQDREKNPCRRVPLRWWLGSRVRTGKTQ